MSSDSASYRASLPTARRARHWAVPGLSRLRSLPELPALIVIAGVLNLWGLGINGWANTYYSAAVRSMTTSWHDFLFASLDRSGLMTVDKPPLALWVQALSARVFGFSALSMLVPQALMGVAATALIYDLTRRCFGRVAGAAAGLTLATTPIVVAISRHNNPDELLVLCCVGALWLAYRALETGRTRWLVWSGLAVGLGFETKMAVALMVVPGIAAAYLWVAPRGRWVALRQLMAGGVALAVAGLAWPVLVTLTPAADRPWISGTADNSIWSLIFSYNGVGRIAGQSGGPGAIGAGGGPGGGTMFGGATGVFRLLQSGLGDQAGWLLGFALVAGLGVLVSSRLRRADPRTGWILAVGGAFLVSAVVFSLAQGIFHPYYVSFLAPFTAALVGAGVGLALRAERDARILAALAIVAGAITELVVLGTLSGQLAWARPLIIGAGIVGALALALRISPQLRIAGLAAALALLLAAPATWAAETIGHATSSTFPTGGPASAAGGMGGAGGFRRGGFGGVPGGRGPGARPGGGFAPPSGTPGAAGAGPTGAGMLGLLGNSSRSGARAGGFPGRPGAAGGGGPGGFGADSASLKAAISYASAHGGGTIAVSSQSSAAAAILATNANVAGLGGFSGRESSVSVAWLAMEVRDGHLRWVISASASQGARLPGDSRQGSQVALSAVAKACRRVTLSGSSSDNSTMYDCQGRASAILAAGKTA